MIDRKNIKLQVNVIDNTVNIGLKRIPIEDVINKYSNLFKFGNTKNIKKEDNEIQK